MNNFIKESKFSTFFSSIDVFFSNYLNPKFKDEALFLAYLFLISRNGFISLFIGENDIYPSPDDLNFEESPRDSIDELTTQIISGSKKVLNSCYTEKKNELIPKHPVVYFESYFYLQKNFVFETFILKNLKRLTSIKPDDLFFKESFFEYLLNEKTLLAEQKKAIEIVFGNSISFIAGGPGSGKTYLASHLIKNFHLSFNNETKKELKIIAAAFTGKAASHLKQTLIKNFQEENVEVMTLHLLLEIKENKNKYFEKDRLNFDLIIVDEAAMIDNRVFAYLLDSIKDGARIVFMGDPDQLPSIEGGNIFSELLNLKIIPAVHLEKPMRFENNIILDMANAIKEEKAGYFLDLLQKVNFFDLAGGAHVKNRIFDESKQYFLNFSDIRLNIEELLDKTAKFRILSSIKKGYLGADNLNNELFSCFYNEAKFNKFLYIPIMVTKNNYQLELYNGDLGILEYHIVDKGNFDGSRAFFTINGKIKEFSVYSIKFYELAYVLSIHKSQGSEFESAIIILPETAQNLGKELLYTGLTRAKNKISIFSTRKHLLKIINKSSFKKSGFSKRLSLENLI